MTDQQIDVFWFSIAGIVFALAIVYLLSIAWRAGVEHERKHGHHSRDRISSYPVVNPYTRENKLHMMSQYATKREGARNHRASDFPTYNPVILSDSGSSSCSSSSSDGGSSGGDGGLC